MQLTCPSCAATYEVEQDPHVFEINCVCGYSLLVPEFEASENDSSAKTDNRPGFASAVPTAMDAEDDKLLIRPEGLMALNPDRKESPSSGGVLDMTPPEELPSGLVYDPFELPQLEPVAEAEVAMDNQDVFAPEPAVSNPSAVSSRPTPRGGSSAQNPVTAVAVEKGHSKTQNLVTRSQLASMGNFLGASFHLKIQDVDVFGIERILLRVQKILSDRPWLEAETKRRQIDFTKLKTDFELRGVPEILALEIYLAAFEFGGHCQFDQTP